MELIQEMNMEVNRQKVSQNTHMDPQEKLCLVWNNERDI